MPTTTYNPLWPVVGSMQAISATSSATGVIAISAASAASAQWSGPNYAIIIAETNDCRWRDDGTAPTATSGMLLKKETYFFYEGKLNAIQFISTAGTTTVDVTLYRASP